jgi:SAM-dependent methyltransferase
MEFMPTLEPTPTADSWAEEDNPRHYDAFARQHPSYQVTSRDLIGRFQPPPDARVLDLACGTGATTRELLAVLGPEGRVIGADKSAGMLAMAASASADPRVTWIQAFAESVNEHVTGPVDAVLCNSAIWQTDLARTAMAVHDVLAIGGRFAFNVPVGFLDVGAGEPADERNALSREMTAIASQDYGWTPPDAGTPLRPRPTLSRESIAGLLDSAGFEVEEMADFAFPESAESLRAWLSVPIFTRDALRGLPYADRMRVLDKAYLRAGPAESQPARWVVFVSRAAAVD